MENEIESFAEGLKLCASDKVYTSSLVILPPQSTWEQLNKIRKRHDPNFQKRPPHIHLLFPFLKRQKVRDLLPHICKALSKFRPFEVSVKQLEYFEHKEKGFVLYARPESPSQELEEMQRSLQSLFPLCSEVSEHSAKGYIPHITLGEFKSRAEVAPFKRDFKPFKFSVSHVCVISRTSNSPFHLSHLVPLGEPHFSPDVRREQLLLLSSSEGVDEEDIFLESKILHHHTSGSASIHVPSWITSPPSAFKIPKELDFFDVDFLEEHISREQQSWAGPSLPTYWNAEEAGEKVLVEDIKGKEESQSAEESEVEKLRRELEEMKERVLSAERRKLEVEEEERTAKREQRRLEEARRLAEEAQRRELEEVEEREKEEAGNVTKMLDTQLLEAMQGEEEALEVVGWEGVPLVDPLARRVKEKKKRRARKAPKSVGRKRREKTVEEAKHEELKRQKTEEEADARKFVQQVDLLLLSRLCRFKRVLLVEVGNALEGKCVHSPVMHSILLSKVPKDVGVVMCNFSSASFYGLCCGGCKKKLGDVQYKKNAHLLFLRDKNKSIDTLWSEYFYSTLSQAPSLQQLVILSHRVSSDNFDPLQSVLQQAKSISTVNLVRHLSFSSEWFSNSTRLEDLFLTALPQAKAKLAQLPFDAKKVNKVLEQNGYPPILKQKEEKPLKELHLHVARKVKGWITRQKKQNSSKLPKDKFALANSIRKFCTVSTLVDVPFVVKFLFENQIVNLCTTCGSWKFDKLLEMEEGSSHKDEDDLSFALFKLKRWIASTPSENTPTTLHQLVSEIASYKRVKTLNVDAVIDTLIEMKAISLGDESTNYLLKYF